MYINVQQANEGQDVEQNSLYDATPRTETIPVLHPTQEHIISPPPEEAAEPKASGTSHEVLGHEDRQSPSPAPPQHLVINTHTSSPSPPPIIQPEPIHQVIHPSLPTAANTNSITTNGSTPPAVRQTTPAPIKPADIFEDAKRKAQLRDMEEKIPVFPTEPDVSAQQLAEMAAKKKAEEDRPRMSATSYPGQEWNPYGEGFEFEE